MLIDLTLSAEEYRAFLNDEKSKAFAASGHIGTHLDTYRKTAIPLDYFRCRGVIFDVRERDETGIKDIDLDAVGEKDFVFFYTGRIEEHPYGSTAYGKDHPQLSHELIRALIDKKIRFIGVDCQGIRRHEEHTPADQLCEEHGIYVIENLKNLGELLDKEITVFTMWLDDPELTGLRCRVLAETE